MGSGFYPKLREQLLAAGCQVLRQGKGSHEVWFSPITNKTFALAVTVTSRHMANTVLKQAGINAKL